MKKSIISKILSLSLVMFMVLIILPTTKAKADPSDNRIKIGDNIYILGMDTLPEGLEWDDTKEELIMDGYDGSYIHQVASNLEEFAIRVIGENKISFSNLTKEAIYIDASKSLKIVGEDKGQDKLIINVEKSDMSRAIYIFDGILKIEKASLLIDFESHNLSNLIRGIDKAFSEKTTLIDGNLEININKDAGTDKGMYGIAGDIELDESSTVKITLNDASLDGAQFPLSSFNPVAFYIEKVYSLSAVYDSESTGSQEHPYKMQVKVAANREKILASDIKYGELYETMASSAAEIQLKDGEGTKFYVQATEGISKDKWYEVTAFKGEDPFYKVEIINGSGSGYYRAGTKVRIRGEAPLEGYKFDKWVTADEINFNTSNARDTYFVMPAKNVSIEATYRLGAEIGIDGIKYELGLDELPSGLTWDKTNNILIMDNYDGKRIHKLEGSSFKDITIKVIGENRISTYNDEDALGFGLGKINIIGENKDDDKLYIIVDGIHPRAIYANEVKLEDVTLDIDVSSTNTSNYLRGTVAKTVVNNGDLIIRVINKGLEQIAYNKTMYGVESLILESNATAKVKLIQNPNFKNLLCQSHLMPQHYY